MSVHVYLNCHYWRLENYFVGKNKISLKQQPKEILFSISDIHYRTRPYFALFCNLNTDWGRGSFLCKDALTEYYRMWIDLTGQVVQYMKRCWRLSNYLSVVSFYFCLQFIVPKQLCQEQQNIFYGKLLPSPKKISPSQRKNHLKGMIPSRLLRRCFVSNGKLLTQIFFS